MRRDSSQLGTRLESVAAHSAPPTRESMRPKTEYSSLLATTICLLIGWATWARGGTPVWTQMPMVWLGVLILGLLILDRFGRTQKREWGGLVFWAGLAFLVFLSIQWWNSGRFPYFHPFDQRWVFTPPSHPAWPSSVDRADAAEMLRWFFPAWVLMLAFRHARHPARLAKSVVWFLVVNAGLLATFGIVQAMSGTHKIFWITPLPEHFFASFGYDNHAASFFALSFALSAGLLLQSLSRAGKIRQNQNLKEDFEQPPSPVGCGEPRKHAKLAKVLAAVSAVLCLAALVLSLSRTGMVFAVGLSGLTLFVAARLFWGRTSVAQRVAVVAATFMGALTLFFVVSTIGGAALSREAHKMTTNLDAREFLIGSAAKMWAADPWFGVGGWGFRHFVSAYAAAEPGRKLSLGYANTHNDTMQFLCEFGIIGFGLMLAAVLAYAWPLLLKAHQRLTPGLMLAGAGLLAVMLHSQIDLPFRSPGILYTWLAVVGVLATRPHQPHRRSPNPA